MFAQFESSMEGVYETLSSELATIWDFDPGDIDMAYSGVMKLGNADRGELYLSAFSCALTAATATTHASAPASASATATAIKTPDDTASSSAGGVLPGGEVHVLGAVLAGIMGVVALW